MSEDLQLNYFNGRGLAETSRLILAIVQQDYKDFRYPLKVVDWKTYSFIREEFDRDKTDGKLTKSLNKVPFLNVGEQVISQSKAIERYLARRHNLFGDTEVQAAQIDALCEWIRDFKNDYQKVRQTSDGEREQAMNSWFTETLPTKLGALEITVGNGFSVGERLSLADITIYSFITQFFDNTEGALAATVNTPNIRSVVELVGNLTTVQEWLTKRPDTPF